MSRPLQMLDALAEIRRIYFAATRQTIEQDIARALELLKHMPDDEARQRAAGYMHGLSDLRREWAPRKPGRPQARGAGSGTAAPAGPPGRRAARPGKPTR